MPGGFQVIRGSMVGEFPDRRSQLKPLEELFSFVNK